MNSEKQLQVLVVTMHQKDFSLVNRMNLHCHAILANQDARCGEEEMVLENSKYKMITTRTVGVGKNRNIALIHATGDYLLFSDDDLVYRDDMADSVIRAFEELPKADAILFGIEFTKNGKVYSVRCPKTKKQHWFSSLRYGAAVLAVKREAILKKHMFFTELFGGGCCYSHGEDSEFILQCFQNGLSVYSYSYVLGSTAKDQSTCFEGYNEKYFYDTGALAKFAFGIIGHFYILYMGLRTGTKSDLPFSAKIRLMNAGYKNFKTLTSYKEWRSNS